MKNNNTYYKVREELRVTIKESLPNLMKLKKEENKTEFNNLLLQLVPNIRRYIIKRIKTAIQKNHFPKNKYLPNDFIGQLFIETYDHIEAFKNEKEFYLWLFKKTNELLEDAIEEEEFDEIFFKNIDDYSKPEWDEMQENYSTDAGGDLLMIEELDDRSYNHNDYTLNHVFIENKEKKWIEKIDKDLSEEDIKKHISMVLHNLPSAMRNVFELFTTQELSLEEIAQIRNNTIKDVEHLLKDAKKALQLSLLNRYTTK